MEVVFESTIIIRNIFESIEGLITTIKLDIKKDGIYVNNLDNNGCSFVCLYISDKDTKKYTFIENVNITIDLSTLNKMLKDMEQYKPISIKYKKGDEKINISQTKDNSNKSKHSIRLSSIEIESIEIPSISLCAEITMSSQELKKIFNKLLLYNDCCKITTLKNRKMIVFSSNGDFGSGLEDYLIDDKTSSIKEYNYDFYTLSYLIKFMKAMNVSESVKICIAKDMPISIQFYFNNSYIKFYLAPKIRDSTDISQQGENIIDDIEVEKEESESEYEEVLVSDHSDE